VVEMESIKVVISEKYLQQIADLNISQHMLNSSTKRGHGDVKALSDSIYLLRDEAGNGVCGIMDAQTFYEALSQSDVAHLFSRGKYANN